MRPGVNVQTLERANPSVIPTDMGQGFMVGVTESGPSAPKRENNINNIDEYQTVYAPSGRSYLPGQRMFDSVNEYFRQGGASLFVGRVTGPASVAAKITVPDASTGSVFEVSAKGEGEWGNDLQVRIDTTTQNPDIPANTYRITIIRDSNDQVLEVSPDIESTEAAIAWAKSDSQYVDIVGLTSLLLAKAGLYDPVGGLNDVANVTNTQWIRGINALDRTLGPGILMLPGVTTNSLHQSAAQSAEATGRVFFEDLPDTSDEPTLIAAVKATLNLQGKRSRFSGAFVPWLITPGPTSGSVRKVPPSVVVAGRFAANMALGMSSNEPAAGDNGILTRILDYSQVWLEPQHENLNNNGVNVIKDIYGEAKIYGWRSTADPVNDKLWITLSNSILHRQVIALTNAVQERFVFRQIDGQGRLIADFQNALVGHVGLVLYEQGAFYGGTPSEAFRVDTGPAVNTPQTIENNELRAVFSFRAAPFGEEFTVFLVKYAISESIPA